MSVRVRPSVRSHDLIPRSGERGTDGRPQLSCIWRPSLVRPLAAAGQRRRPPNEVTLTRMTEALDLGLTDDRGGGGGEGGRYVYFASHARLRRRGQLYYLSRPAIRAKNVAFSRVQRKCQNSRGYGFAKLNCERANVSYIIWTS